MITCCDDQQERVPLDKGTPFFIPLIGLLSFLNPYLASGAEANQ